MAKNFGRYRLEHGVLMGNDELLFEMRKYGVPYVWPTTLVVVTRDQDDDASTQLKAWLASLPPHAQRRCGVATITEGTVTLTALVVTDALADVRPVPRQGRVGQWLPLEVQLHVAVEKVEVVALGPTGAPFLLPSSVNESGRVRAQLPLQRSGRWLFQVLPTFEHGPRPVTELEVFADTPLPEAFQSQPVPGESSSAIKDATPELAMLNMLNEARLSEGLPALQLNEVLSVVAADHAAVMRARQQVSHDVGSGDPGTRVARFGLSPGVVAENIARAGSIVGAHRAIWQSPSHRRSLLHTEFTQVGLGIVRDPNGDVWVCQLFVDRI